MNPFFDADETSLGKLSERNWNILRSHHSMYSGYSFCRKLGRHWTVEGFGLTGPLFKTKREAESYVTNLILAESRHRAFLKWERSSETERLAPGQRVTMSDFPGTVVNLYSDGPTEGARMYEVRLPGGVGCYCGADLARQ